MRTLIRARRTPGDTSSGIGMLVFGASSQQFGAAVGASLFPVLGPIGVVAMRQLVMAAVHLPLGRPPVSRMSRTQLALGVGLGVVMGMMNLTLYLAIDRIGLGLAVTLEFLGPLALALLSSKRLINVVCALAAAAGVYILAGPQTSNDLVGILLGLTAGACWAGYILTNRAAGARLPGLQASALAAATSVVMFVPVAAFTVDLSGLTTTVVLIGVLAGVLSSAVPYAADLFVLRRIPPGLYSLMVSIHPALAALAGLILLSETLTVLEIVAIGVITLANVLAVSAVYRTNSRHARPAVSEEDQDVP